MSSRLFRLLALFLSTQPAFWVDSVALAQASRPFLDRTDAAHSAAHTSRSAGEDLLRARRGDAGREDPTGLEAARATVSAIDEPVDSNKYVCGTGDVFELNVWGVESYKLRAVVDVEGRAFIPRLGYFDVSGKTLTEVRRTIREALRHNYPRLSCDMTLVEPRTFMVQLADQVVAPGSYAARPIERVATVLERGGGIVPKGSLRRVEIRRRGGSVISADLLLYRLTGDVKHNPYVLDGDVIRVPAEKLAAFIGGAVNRPGRYELVASRDLSELLDLAGGFAPSATNQLPLRVVRRQADDLQEQELLAFFVDAPAPALAIGHEDSVIVPDAAEVQQSVVLTGALSDAATPEDATATRRVPFIQGDSVRTLLERVGGLGPAADLDGSYILRRGNALPIDLYSLMMLRDLKADRQIELGDTLVVPFKRRSILVQGAVFAPGPYPYNPTYTIDQYLALAGGRNRFARPLGDVRVITPTGQTQDYEADLQVDPGSSLVVPERNFSRSELVQIALGAAGIILSGVAVVLSTRK